MKKCLVIASTFSNFLKNISSWLPFIKVIFIKQLFAKTLSLNLILVNLYFLIPKLKNKINNKIFIKIDKKVIKNAFFKNLFSQINKITDIIDDENKLSINIPSFDFCILNY